MSRTIRKSKWGNTYNDGKENYKCKCSWCTKEEKEGKLWERSIEE